MQNSQSPKKLSNAILEQINQNQRKYRQISQVAYYSSLEYVEQLQVFTKSSCDVQCNVTFCFNATNYNPDKKQQTQLFIIRTLNEEIPKLKNRYSIAYIHESVSTFLYFRSIIRLLPAEHLIKLKNLYVVHAGLAVRFVQMFSFGEINSYFKQKTIHSHNVEEIETANKITFGGNVSKSKLKLLNTQNEQPRNTMTHTKEMQSSDVQIIRNKLYGKQLSQYDLSSNNIPKVIQELVIKLYSNQTFLQAEGIMRKSCDVEQLQILEGHIMDDPEWQKFIKYHENVYVLCGKYMITVGCLKKIFNNLNSPLFSFEIYDQIISYRTDNHKDNDIKFLRGCISKMQKINRLVLFYIATFLYKGIIQNQQHNKMSAYNLAVVFGPCFFRPKQYTLQDLMSSGKFSFMIKLLLENIQDVIGQVFIEMVELLQKQRKI